MKIIKYLNNLIKKLNPDQTAEDRIKEKVFARLNLEMPQRKPNLIDLFTMNKKIIVSTLSVLSIVVFVGLPVILNNKTEDKSISLGFSNLNYEAPLDNVYLESSPTAVIETDKSTDGYNSNSIADEETETKETERAKEKWAELYLQVNNISETISTIYDLTGTVEGYVISSSYSTETQEGYGNITIRVPSEKFDYTIQELRSYSINVLEEQTSIVDIQNEITENENTLTELRKELDQEYANLETATTNSEKTTIQNRINQLENQIEIYEEEASDLEQRASFSTIEINLTQEEEIVVKEKSLKNVFEKALEVAKVILGFWAEIAIWGIFVIPTVGLPVLAFFGVKKLKIWMKNIKK